MIILSTPFIFSVADKQSRVLIAIAWLLSLLFSTPSIFLNGTAKWNDGYVCDFYPQKMIHLKVSYIFDYYLQKMVHLKMCYIFDYY